jgi:uncharacterized membrane protein
MEVDDARGLGLGGFFDGIVLHQILQWHHILTSAGHPSDSVENLKLNTLWDGIFHASTGGRNSSWSARRRTRVRHHLCGLFQPQGEPRLRRN